MAIAHFHAGIVSRGQGRSSVDAAAYASRSRMIDQRTGIVYDYSRNAGDIVASFVWLPKGADESLRNREALWNYAESRETRINSRTARTFEVALPHELTEQQREQLLKNFIKENFTRKGLAVDVSIHKPHSHGDERNHHAHIVVPTRFMDSSGLGAKDRESNQLAALEGWRESWQNLANRHLERFGHEARIDMRSYADQGREQTPQIHIGQAHSEMERKGIATERGDQARAIQAENAERSQQQTNDNAQLEKTAQDQGIAWTEGRARRHELKPELVETVSAVDRQRQQDQADHTAAQREAALAEARAARAPLHLRMMASAIRALGIKSGQMVSNVMGRADADTIAASMKAERQRQIAEAQHKERMAATIHAARQEGNVSIPSRKTTLDMELSEPDQDHAAPAAAPKSGSDREQTWMAQSGGYEALTDQLKHSAQTSYEKWQASPAGIAKVTLGKYVSYVQEKERERAGTIEQANTSSPPSQAGQSADARSFVDRGRRAAPYRAMLGELRGNEQDGTMAIGAAADRAGTDRVWSHEAAVPASPAQPFRPEAGKKGFIERLEAQQKAKGQALADLLPHQQRDRQRENELGHELDLGL